jgi:hypothetical protein
VSDEDTDLKYNPDAETLAMSQTWLSTRPEIIRELFAKCPPWNCYRSKEMGTAAHYSIAAYDENGTVRVIHGRDSFLPGVSVFGVKPETLVACGCGAFKFPTTAQVAKTGEKLKARRAELEKRRKLS